MTVRYSYMTAARELTDPQTDAVLGSTDLRIYYRYCSGYPADLWGDCPHPEEPPTVDLHEVRQKVAGKWVPVSTADDLWAWAEQYFAAHESEAFEDAAADAIAAVIAANLAP